MKKMICLVLALVLALGLCVSAFAVDVNGVGSNTGDKNVNVNVTADSTAKVYAITVTWDAFAYTHGNKGTWQPATHTYSDENKVGAEWTKNTVTVTVVNHSNAPINYTATFADVDDGVTVTPTNVSSTQIAAGIEGEANKDAKYSTFTLTASGTPDESAGSHKVGELTVTFAAA